MVWLRFSQSFIFVSGWLLKHMRCSRLSNIYSQIILFSFMTEMSRTTLFYHSNIEYCFCVLSCSECVSFLLACRRKPYSAPSMNGFHISVASWQWRECGAAVRLARLPWQSGWPPRHPSYLPHLLPHHTASPSPVRPTSGALITSTYLDHS